MDYAPVFNGVYYRKMNPDVEKVYGTDKQKLFGHFLQYGMSEGRQGCAGFDVMSYKKRHPELKLKELREYYRYYCVNG